MAWTASSGFRQTMIDILDKTLTGHDLDQASMCKMALYDNAITPDGDVSAANSAFNAGQWATAHEVSATGWASGGIVLVNNDVLAITKGYKFDADDPASAAGTTMSGIYGGLVYLDAVTTPVADQGLCFLYFGGTAYAVTNGVFTVQLNAAGIYTFTWP